MSHYSAEILTIFGSYFGRNDDFINSFWNLLTFSTDRAANVQQAGKSEQTIYQSKFDV